MPPGGNLGFEKGSFYEGKMKDFAAGTIPGPDGSPIGSRGGLRRTFGTCGVVGKLSKLTNSAFSRGETRIRLTLKEGVIRDLRRGPALGGREARGTGTPADLYHSEAEGGGDRDSRAVGDPVGTATALGVYNRTTGSVRRASAIGTPAAVYNSDSADGVTKTSSNKIPFTK